MKTIKVLSPFVLHLPEGITHSFAVGVYEVEAHVAEHWFVQAHAEAIVVEPAAVPSPAPVHPAPKKAHKK